jgi:hypothetical protein
LLAPALKLLYSVAGRVLLIDAEDEWSAHAVSNLLARWFLTPLLESASPHAIIKISLCSTTPDLPAGLAEFEIAQGGICHTDGRALYLDFDGSFVIIGPGKQPQATIRLAQRYDLGSEVLAQVISQAFAGVLRRTGLFELHSGAVVPPKHQRTILIAGASGSGKSTLTFQLAARGWDYLSDDTLLLENALSGIEVWGLRRFFALTPQTIAAVDLPHLPLPADATELKKRLTPQDLFTSRQIRNARPAAIVFPEITFEKYTRVRSLSSAEGMTRLLRLCPWAGFDKATAQEHLRTLEQLVNETVSVEMLAGVDVLEDSALVSDLLVPYARS